MTNEELSEAMTKLKLMPKVPNMACMALDSESDFVQDFAMYSDLDSLQEVWPQIEEEPESMMEFHQFLFKNNLNGFLVELNFPSITESYFNEDGSINIQSVSYGICTVTHAYGKDLEDLYKQIVIEHDWVLQKQIDKIKSR